ncbi:cupin domain-containing protein [Thauera sinica]|uniref:Cupin domain-containing protein n=1 Tax=Thauera sinica TaxID=2665146 RepID=A0ABW1API5_9RHOO|nr:cupin domain-containing protein [Thauera sp. K11]ATE62237.1 cupin [Thauera sp. K11]
MTSSPSRDTAAKPASAWKVFDLDSLRKHVEGSEPRIHEFLRSAAMSCAIYRLPAGARDMQAPHLEDEVYLVLEGKARLHLGDQVEEVGPGMVLFVGATTEHSFFDIQEDLTLLAIFGPAPGTLQRRGAGPSPGSRA